MQTQKPRNVAIFCDGTGNEFGSKQTNTNVIRLFQMIEVDEGQIAFYDPGVGTSSSMLTRVFQKFQMGLKMAVGTDLQENVEDAYRFLMENYRDGDRIFIFGFSRGAHTARRLACMIDTCGILNKGNENLIPYVYKVYLDDDKEVQRNFSYDFCRSCQTYFVGAWDTVSALPKFFVQPKLDGILSPKVNFAYYAVSVRESRYMFPPNLWIETGKKTHQVVEQVWFDGVHSDVGGGYDENGLSNIPLKWMAERAARAELRFLSGTIDQIAVNPDAKRHWSWVWHWWIIPFHMYLCLTAGILGLIELVSSAQPLSYLGGFLAEHPLKAGIALLAFSIFNRKSRKIPPNAKIHQSVKTYFESQSRWLRPRNLKRVWHSIEWVE